MPKQPKTYDEFLGRVIGALAEERGMRQEDVAEAAGLSLTSYGRRERGEVAFMASEIERIAEVLSSSPGEIMQRALKNYGGIEKLLSEVRRSKEGPGDEASGAVGPDDPDNITPFPIQSRAESKKTQERPQAALDTPKDQGQ